MNPQQENEVDVDQTNLSSYSPIIHTPFLLKSEDTPPKLTTDHSNVTISAFTGSPKQASLALSLQRIETLPIDQISTNKNRNIHSNPNARNTPCYPFPVPKKTNFLYRIFHIEPNKKPNEDVGSSTKSLSEKVIFAKSKRDDSESESEHSDCTDMSGTRLERSASSLTLPRLFHRPAQNDASSVNTLSRKRTESLKIISEHRRMVDTENDIIDDSTVEDEKKSNLFYWQSRKKAVAQSHEDLTYFTKKENAMKKKSAPISVSNENANRKKPAPITLEAEIHDEKSTHHSSYHSLFKDLVLGHWKGKEKSSPPANDHNPIVSPLIYISPEISITPNLPTPILFPPLEPISPERPTLSRQNSESSLSQKYGKTTATLGKGAFATVKLCSVTALPRLKYAIKEFKKRRSSESHKGYVKRLVGEFCVASALDHENVVKTFDLIKDDDGGWCVVMEYLCGGDLLARIQAGTLTDVNEIDCYFKQMCKGVAYLQSVGVSHRDLKPENILIEGSGRRIKITDFGVSQVFKSPFCSECTKGKGKAGTGPYIAPEEFEETEYDPTKVDVWSIAIIYYIMIYNQYPWKQASMHDSKFKMYVDQYKHFPSIERLPRPTRVTLYGMLNIHPAQRLSIGQVLETEWISGVEECIGEQEREGMNHSHPNKA